MKKCKRILAGILAGVLSVSMLTACSNGTGKKAGNVKLENGEITENSIVIKVGDMGVKYSEVRNYCYLMKKQYESVYSDKLWSYSLDKQTTIGDEAKEEIVNLLTQLKIIGATAKKQKVELTSDEKDEALQKAEEIVKSASKEDKKAYCLTVQGMAELYEENILANKMFYIATDDADTNVTDTEARQAKIQYIQIMTEGINRNKTTIHLNESEKEDARKKAEKLAKEARDTGKFAELAEKNSDSAKTEITIGADAKEPEEKVVTAAMALEKGQISQVISGDKGYYIVYCEDDNDEDATYARKEEIIQERQTKMFKKKYRKWLGEYQVNISQSFWQKFEI